jgi:hypothetical protein
MKKNLLTIPEEIPVNPNEDKRCVRCINIERRADFLINQLSFN